MKLRATNEKAGQTNSSQSHRQQDVGCQRERV